MPNRNSTVQAKLQRLEEAIAAFDSKVLSKTEKDFEALRCDEDHNTEPSSEPDKQTTPEWYKLWDIEIERYLCYANKERNKK